MVERTNRILVSYVALTISVLVTSGCGWFPESTFELANESRLPIWITLPPGLTRTDVSLTMSYYIWPWGRRATFTLRDKDGRTLAKVHGKVTGLKPLQLKHPPPGFPAGYPAYEIIAVSGKTEIIEHRKMEPIFYVADDPAVWRELGQK
jgi:hypothetical protein